MIVVKIFIDSRESGAVFSAFRRAANDPALLKTLKETSVEIIQQNNMESGDFVCGECAIEHKTPNDYRQSIMSRHLADQTQMMKRNFKECAIAYSGSAADLFHDSFGRIDKFGTGTFASYMVQGIPVMICQDFDTMAVIVIKLLHKWTDDKVRDNNPNINQRIGSDVQLCIMTAIDGIGEELGNTVLDHFGTIEKVVAASIEDLVKIPDIGEKRAIDIYSAFHSPRW